MKIRMLPFLTAGALSWAALSASAQPGERQPPPAPAPERIPAPAQVVPPAPVPAPAPLPVAEPAPCAECPPVDKILFFEKKTPVCILEPKEIITQEVRPTYEIAYREEKCKITELVTKTREVEKLVPVTILVPCTEVDPHTGKACTINKTCTELRPIKQTEIYTIPETREVVKKIPYLKPTTEVVKQKHIVFEAKTVYNKDDVPVRVPGTPVKPTQHYVTEKPECPCPEGK